MRWLLLFIGGLQTRHVLETGYIVVLETLRLRLQQKLGGSSASSGTTTPTQPSTNTSFPKTPFTVQVLVSDLNIRKGAGMNYGVTGKYTGKGVFTITSVNNGWGKLKSGADGFIWRMLRM